MKFDIDWGLPALISLIQNYEFKTVLDVGSGAGEHKRLMEYLGKTVKSADYDKAADYPGDFMKVEIPEQFDAIWCSHVIEHQRNVGLFLERIYRLLKEDGVLAIVAPLHPNTRLVAGHITSWSIYLLIYNLVLAGFDCKDACVLSNYELSLIVRKKPCPTNDKWENSVIGDFGDDPFGSVKSFFPIDAFQAAQIAERGSIQWKPAIAVLAKPAKIKSRYMPGGEIIFEKE